MTDNILVRLLNQFQRQVSKYYRNSFRPCGSEKVAVDPAAMRTALSACSGVRLAGACGGAQEAAHGLEAALEVRPSVEAAFDLVLCAFAGGDPEVTRRAFAFLLQAPGTPPPPLPPFRPWGDTAARAASLLQGCMRQHPMGHAPTLSRSPQPARRLLPAASAGFQAVTGALQRLTKKAMRTRTARDAPADCRTLGYYIDEIPASRK